MESTAEEQYAAFINKVERIVHIDNLSPHVTDSALINTFNQFGTVKGVTFIANYLEPKNRPRCALVEMEEVKQAAAVIQEVAERSFMVSGKPRPVTARTAEVEMFEDRPVKPGRRVEFRWIDPSDPDIEEVVKQKCLVKRHAAEASYLLKLQLDREEKLHNQQRETV